MEFEEVRQIIKDAKVALEGEILNAHLVGTKDIRLGREDWTGEDWRLFWLEHHRLLGHSKRDAYVMKLENLKQVKILTDYLAEMDAYDHTDVGYLSVVFKVNEDVGVFSKGDIAAGIIMEREDLTKSFVEEVRVCSKDEVPTYQDLDELPKKSNGHVENMDQYPEITLENLHLLFVR